MRLSEKASPGDNLALARCTRAMRDVEKFVSQRRYVPSLYPAAMDGMDVLRRVMPQDDFALVRYVVRSATESHVSPEDRADFKRIFHAFYVELSNAQQESNMKMSVSSLRRLIKEIVEENELNYVEPGDVVKVYDDLEGIISVRVTRLVDDVRKAYRDIVKFKPKGYVFILSSKDKGPGFVGNIETPGSEMSNVVYSLEQVLPGSKLAGFFPKDTVNNPYRNAVEPDLDF